MTALTQQYELKNVDWATFGNGDARDGNTTVTVSGVTGSQRFAFLYWGELNFSGSSDTQITVNGTAVTGTTLGTSVDTCWGSDQSVGYFANVSDIVNGDGSYTIEGMGEGGQGASLVVFYDDGDATNNRDVTIFAGNDSTDQSGSITTINLGNLEYESGTSTLTLFVGDGQSFTDGDLTINSTLLGTNQFPGGDGALWDINTYDITSVLSPGDNNLAVTHVSDGDCLQFVTAIVDKAAKPPVLFLDFDTAIPRDYYVTYASYLGFLGLDARETSATRAGTEPLGVFTAAQKTELVGLVQDIFDRSGIAMDVTSTQPTSGDYHSVRFTSTKLRYDTTGDGNDNARLLGQAYEGVDRYNTEDNNIVAVLMDGSDAMLSVAETVAHEGAHAFGARHINPVQGSGAEVMDYDSSGLETFVKTPANITEPPVDGKPATSVTHNPAYHIRRYVNEESDTQLRLEGLTPGTWDRTAFENILYSLGLSDLTQSLSDLYVLVLGRDPLVEGDDESFGTLIPVAENIDSSGNLTFTVPEGSEFRIVASTGDSSLLDAVLELDPDADDPYAMTANPSSNPSGTLVMDDGTGNPVAIGSFALEVEEVIEVADAEALAPLFVSINRNMESEAGPDATVTVSRGTDTTGDLTVVLSSTDTSAATLPGTAIIPDGETEVEVSLSMIDDFRLDGLQTTTILALAEGYESASTNFDVIDDETAIMGTLDPDDLTGTPDLDGIFGFAGDDRILGLESNDIIGGGLGNDTAVGGPGADILSGGSNDDVLIGGSVPPVEELGQTSGAQVFRVFGATLDRIPDSLGYDNWSGQLESGAMVLTQVITGFVASPEFQATYGALDDEAFVTLLYNNVLDRDPDAGGLANWLSQLASGTTREEVVRGFSQSPEYIAQTNDPASAYVLAGIAAPFADDVYRLYEATLDREPDVVGLTNWSTERGMGTSYLDVASGFVNSPEFQATYGALDDEAFVTLLYNNVLDRDPDATGLANWLQLLSEGASREEVVEGFAQSPEFVAKTAEAFAAYMAATEGDTYDGGPGDDLMSGSLLADDFIFEREDAGRDRVLEVDAFDTVSFHGFGYADAAEARSHMTEVNLDVVFADQGVSVIFMHTDMETIDSMTIQV